MQKYQKEYKANLLDFAFVAEQSDELYCIQISYRTLALLLPMIDYIGWKTRYINTDGLTQDVIDAWRDETAYRLMNIVECGTVTDPCCPETNELLSQIAQQNDRLYALLKAGATVTFNGGAVAIEPIPDCAPEKFNGNPDDTPSEADYRQKAICLAVRRLVSQITYSEFIKLGIKSRDVSVLIAKLEPLPAGAFAGWVGTGVQGLVSGDYVLIDTNPVAYDEAVCCLHDKWFAEKLTIENFATGMSNCPAPLIPLTTEDRYHKIIPYYLNQGDNFISFSKELDRAYEDVKAAPDEYDATCGCGSPPIMCGIFTDERIVSGQHFPACPYVQIGERTYRFSAVKAPDGYTDVWNVHFRSIPPECFIIENWVFTFETERHVSNTGLSYSYTCDAVIGGTPVINICYSEAFISFGSPLGGSDPNGARFYVDVTFAEGCCEPTP